MSEIELHEALEKLNGWTRTGDSVSRRWEFKNFADALAFVNRVGEIAEAADHHPDIKLGWGYCEIGLTTHDRGGVTDVDIAMAAKFDLL